MGRGGRAAYGPGGDRVAFASHVLEDSPLADRPIAELQKHAEQRGLKTDGTRDDLLIALRPYSKVRAVEILEFPQERGGSCRTPTPRALCMENALQRNNSFGACAVVRSNRMASLLVNTRAGASCCCPSTQLPPDSDTSVAQKRHRQHLSAPQGRVVFASLRGGG